MTISAPLYITQSLQSRIYFSLLVLILTLPMTTHAANFGLEQQIAADAASRHEMANFGGSVAIDGDTAVVGAFRQSKLNDNDTVGEFGAAYIYERQLDDSWDQVAKLTTPNQSSKERFGWAVAIKNNTVIVGAPEYSNAGKISIGRAFIYRKTGTGWDTDAVLELSPNDNAAGAQFGYSVDIANPGTADAYTFVIGAWGDDKETDTTKLFVGSVYVYQVADISIPAPVITANVPTVLDATAKLIDPDGIGKDVTFTEDIPVDGDALGNAIAISADGKTIVAGAFGNVDNVDPPALNPKEAGTVFVWQQSTGDWKDFNHLTQPPTRELNIDLLATNDRFGASVDINADGSIIVAGARGLDYLDSDNNPINGVGAVYLYSQPDQDWSGNVLRKPERRLTADTPIEGDRIGSSVTIDPASALIASGMSDFDIGHSGRPEKVLVWHQPTGGWDDSIDDLINDLSLIATDRPIGCAGLNAGNVDCDYFGASISNSVWTDGSSIIIGAAGHDNLNTPTTSTPNEFGIAYIYSDTDNVVNTIPNAVTKSVTFAKNASGAITLDGSDADVGDPVSFSVLSEPVRGTLTGTPPNLTYQAENDDYTDSFIYKAYDGTDFSEEAVISITVGSGDPTPAPTPTTSGGGGGAFSGISLMTLFLLAFTRRKIRY